MSETAHIEFFSGCLRIFETNKGYGDDYIFSCSLHWINLEEVELKGVTSFSTRFRRPICATLLNKGVKVLRFTRKVCNESRMIRVCTKTCKILKEGG